MKKYRTLWGKFHKSGIMLTSLLKIGNNALLVSVFTNHLKAFPLAYAAYVLSTYTLSALLFYLQAMVN